MKHDLITCTITVFSQHAEKLLVILLQETLQIIKKKVPSMLNQTLIFNQSIFPLGTHVGSWKCCSEVGEVSTKTGGTASPQVLEESMCWASRPDRTWHVFGEHDCPVWNLCSRQE